MRAGWASIASCAVAAAGLAGCSAYPTTLAAVQAGAYPATTNAAYLEYGRITAIESIEHGTTTSRINVPTAVVGGVVNEPAGNQTKSASGGRDAAKILGGAAGASIGGAPGGSAGKWISRITIETESGAYRIYDVPSTAQLRAGDRVRVENGVIYPS